jgi:micrococcal nuclease|tara:strand:+ start:8228 stop:8656 length:429 start_codon:yes stop_codon:yes gene_type:complete
MKHFLLIAILAGLVSCQTTTSSTESSQLGPVISVESYRSYPAHIDSIYDGDTVTATIDLGFDLNYVQSIRLLGINAPEVRGVDKINGLASRDHLRSILMGKDVTILVPKKERGKYGRILGDIILDGKNINDSMVESGFAETY